MFNFCWHKWKIVDTVVLPSLIEQSGGKVAFELTGIDPSHKPCIVKSQCIKCAMEKVKRI